MDRKKKIRKTAPGSEFMKLVHPADRAAIRNRYLRRPRGEDVSNLYPHRIIGKKGNVKWVEVNNVLISWQKKPAVLCFMRDITEKKEAEDALRRSERHLADIINFLWLVMIHKTFYGVKKRRKQ
jgi:PAS domain-containing protein